MNQKLSIALLAAALIVQPGCRISFGTGNPNDNLILAAEKGDVQGAQDALDDGADVNAKVPGAPGSNLNNMSALRQAAQNGNTDVVKLLLDKGAQVDITDSLGVTPLIIAAQNGQLEPIQLLVAKGANVNAKASGLGDMTALIMAAQDGHLDVVNFLISNGADVNAKGMKGITAIRIAAQNGHLSTVQALANAKADINVVDELGYTPLSIAQQEQRQDVVEFLLSKGAKAPQGTGASAPHASTPGTMGTSPQGTMAQIGTAPAYEGTTSDEGSMVPALPTMPAPPSSTKA